MKTDRELLELAAKAARYKVRWHDVWKSFVHELPINTDNPPTFSGQRLVWAPLQDDGDALRLAVRLGMLQTHTQAHARFAMFYACCLDKDMRPSEATRCAIVSAAAEIGKAIA